MSIESVTTPVGLLRLAFGSSCLLASAASFYATARWNNGLWFCVVAYLAGAFVWPAGMKRAPAELLRDSRAKILISFLYLTFVLCVVGGLWGEYVNVVLYGVDSASRSMFMLNNGLFAVLVCEVLVVKWALAPISRNQ